MQEKLLSSTLNIKHTMFHSKFGQKYEYDLGEWLGQ